MAVRFQDIDNDVYEDSGREEILNDTNTALKRRAMHNPAIHRLDVAFIVRVLTLCIARRFIAGVRCPLL